jgi:hypothetical protein
VLATTLIAVDGNPDDGSTINTFSSTLANGNFGNPINTFGPINFLDQPWIETGPANQVYIAYNDLSRAGTGLMGGTSDGKTAAILVSSDGGVTYKSIVLDQVGGKFQDDPAVREAVNGNTVYAVFDRWTGIASSDANGTQWDSQVVVVKSVDAGADFTAGVQVATPIIPFAPPNNVPAPTSLTIGDNRIGAGSAIAVDPTNANHVVVAYDAVTGSLPDGQGAKIQVIVQESNNGGMDWNQTFSSSATTRSGQAELAILNNGAIGLIYNSYDPSTNQLSVHLVTTTNDFATTTDTILATQINNVPASAGDPYLGDYMQLVAVGNSFEGVFSASNADNGTSANFPNGVIFQRNFTGTPGTASFQLKDANGLTDVPASIDPFFFKFTPPVNIVGVALDHAMA